jgi:hypothetical protein
VASNVPGRGILGFFDPAVLAPYREQPDKYVIATDYFDGRVTVTSEYYEQLDEKVRTNST